MRLRTTAILATAALGLVIPASGLSQQSTTIGTGAKTCALGPGADCRGVVHRWTVEHHGNLRKAKFTKADLRGADFRGADLRGADFRGAKLHHVDMRGAKVKGARFDAPPRRGKRENHGCVDTSVDCMGANLEWGQFTNMDARGANFTNAFLGHANFTGAWADWANFTGAELYDVNFTWAELSLANFTGADLTKANFTSADLTITNLRRSNLTNATLTNANLGRTLLKNSNLTGVQSGGITNPTTDLPQGWILTNGYLVGPGANLTSASLSSANLTGINLTGAILTGVQSGAITGVPSTLPQGWILTNGYLVGPGANLTSASLSSANL
ncbi:MAG: pentapeptide repeat-containing protein, partial [Acidobacteria bacterium]|nr:pentapeptide repeat-containing protein [Acidobacteriota bacterium]